MTLGVTAIVRHTQRILVLCQSTKCKFWWYFDYSLSIFGPLGKHGSDWSRDLATLTFALGGHGACGWCGSSSSIRLPNLKFVILAIGKKWRTMCVSINGSFYLEIGMQVTLKVENLPSNLGTLGLLVLELFAMYATDGRTKATLIAPFPTGPEA